MAHSIAAALGDAEEWFRKREERSSRTGSRLSAGAFSKSCSYTVGGVDAASLVLMLVLVRLQTGSSPSAPAAVLATFEVDGTSGSYSTIPLIVDVPFGHAPRTWWTSCKSFVPLALSISVIVAAANQPLGLRSNFNQLLSAAM